MTHSFGAAVEAAAAAACGAFHLLSTAFRNYGDAFTFILATEATDVTETPCLGTPV